MTCAGKSHQDIFFCLRFFIGFKINNFYLVVVGDERIHSVFLERGEEFWALARLLLVSTTRIVIRSHARALSLSRAFFLCVLRERSSS